MSTATHATNQENPYVLCFIIFKLDMQAILDPDLHLDRHIRVRRHPIAVHPDFALLDDVAHPASDGDAEEVAARWKSVE